jgi:putative heme iron utilization protein
MGHARKLGAAQAAEVRSAYLARQPRACYWVDFDDFAFWLLDLRDVYFVGGFAAMAWVTVADYAAARPDPLADAAPGIIQHMNQDHADALVAYAQHYAGEAPDEAVMVAVDRLGFKLRLRQGDRLSSVRIPFPREVTTTNQSREVLIDMLRRARGE